MDVTTTKVLFIPSGSINKIISQLKTQNINVTKFDSFILRFIGSPQKGWINIGATHLSKADFLYKLISAKAALEPITLVPGETTYIFLHQLSLELSLKQKKLQYYYNQYAYEKEGALVPNTYFVPININAKQLIVLLLKQSLKHMQNLSKKLLGSYNKQIWFKYITIASIIQKEAGSKKDMPLIGSVIYNRLKKNMRLQMDGALNYGKYSHIPITAKRIKIDKSTYNTYIHAGLPKYPVCNVSLDAIKAAISPAKTNFLYFIKKRDGTQKFSCNFSTHLHNIRDATK